MTREQLYPILKSLTVKVDMLAWIGIMPDPYATMIQFEMLELKKQLVNENISEDEFVLVQAKIAEGHKTMDEGINIILNKLNSADCCECGDEKCVNLKGVLNMLVDKFPEPIDHIITEIEKHFGPMKDLIKKHGAGMPGHESDIPGHPNVRVLEVGSGRGNVSDLIDALSKAIDEHGGEPGEYGVFASTPKPENPIRKLISNLLGEKVPDKDKLH